MNDEMPRHPEAQTMAAFVDGTLAREEIAVVASHLRDCADCRLIVTETARFEREEASIAPRRTWWLAVAAAVALLAVGALIVTILVRRASPIRRLIAAAPRQHRSVEARLSGFPWAQLQAPSRGEARPDPADLKLDGAAGDVLDTTADRSDPLAGHARGVAYLVIGRRGDSITALEAAAARSTDPLTWNDLAAARYASAISDERPSQLPEALAAVDHALRLDPHLAEAQFNRALILERLGLLDHARKAWQSYLALDPNGGWSAEARAHLQRLQPTSRRFDPKLLETQPAAQLARDFPEESRRWGEAVVLANWADAETAHDPARAAAILTRARDLGSALATLHGEHLLEDAVAAIDRASGVARAALAQGHQEYRAARMDYNRRHMAAAEKGLRDAEALFTRGGSPMAAVSSYFAASAAFDQQRTDEAHDELARMLAATDAARYPALAAQLHWELAVCANSAGDWGTAARESATATTIFRTLGERSNTAIVDGIATMALELIGATDLAWGRRVQTFAQLSASGAQTLRINAILRSAAGTLASLDHVAAAEALLDLIRESGGSDPAQRSMSEAERARIAVRSGDLTRARDALMNARAATAQVTDGALQELVRAKIDVAEGSAGGAQAIASLDRSIDHFARRGMSVELADAYLQRARAGRTAGRTTEALADYDRASAEIGKQQATIRDAEARLRFLDVAGRIREETIDLRLTTGDTAGAFAAADRASRIPTVPQGGAIVEYAVLPHALVAFCVTPAGLVAHRTEIDRRELEARVTAFVDRIRRRAPLAEIDAEGAALYHLLLEPFEGQLAGAHELIIVPDRLLYALPFGALRGTQYLIERFALRVAANASWSADEPAPLTPALVVADPPTQRWPRLPASRDEAARIAALYGATPLTGEEATRSAFTDAARGSALIHFSGHANSDAGSSYAALLLAANGNDAGALGSADVARLHLERHPLVVLAACGTFRGDALHVAGMSSLARAFLLAGARGVIGTLWEIDDDVSAPLFLRLHQHLRQDMAPASALRQAQLDQLHATDSRLAHPATWAPVETVTSQPISQPES